MLSQISILSCFIFSVLYPLCFWISFQDPLGQGFHRFHIGLPAFLGGITLFAVFCLNVPSIVFIFTGIWLLGLLITAKISWNKKTVDLRLCSISTLLGCIAFGYFSVNFIGKGYAAVAVQILAGLIFCISIYAMNLGHWYLNVAGLPIWHLRRTVFVFAGFLSLRLAWDVIKAISGSVLYDGEVVPIWQFMITLEGMFLGVAIFFGTFFPLIILHFVDGTLKVKSTQSATGILYVIVSAILIGDMAYKYYLIRFGLLL